MNGTAYSSASNSITAIPGLNITLAGTGTTTVSVGATGGALKALGIMDSGEGLAHETVKARDAAFTVDGTTFLRSGNTVSDAVQGLTFSLKRAGTTAVELSEAAGSLLDKVKDWVSKYNDVVSSLKTKIQYNAKTKTAGPLNGDFLAGELFTKLRLNATKPVAGLTPLDSLDDVGISTGNFGSANADKLVIDEAILGEKLSSARQDMMRLFGAPTEAEPDPTSGIARDISGLADSYTHSQIGLVAQHETMLESRIESLQKQVDGWEDRLARREVELFRKYTQMEVQLSRMRNRMAALGSSLDKLV
jgi:flagellar hook-associated protein 2